MIARNSTPKIYIEAIEIQHNWMPKFFYKKKKIVTSLLKKMLNNHWKSIFLTTCNGDLIKYKYKTMLVILYLKKQKEQYLNKINIKINI